MSKPNDLVPGACAVRPRIVSLRRLLLTVLAALAAVPLFPQTTLIEQGRAAISRGDSDAAIDLLEKAVAQSPKSAEAHFYLSNAYGSKIQASGMFGAAKYASKIRDECEKAVALNPKYIDARFGLVQFYAGAPGLMGGSYEKALEQAKEIKAIDPIAGHRAYAFVYSQQKKLDLAKREYADAIREEPTSPKAHRFAGGHESRSRRGGAEAVRRLHAEGERAAARQRALLAGCHLREAGEKAGGEAGLPGRAQAQSHSEASVRGVEARVMTSVSIQKY